VQEHVRAILASVPLNGSRTAQEEHMQMAKKSKPPGFDDTLNFYEWSKQRAQEEQQNEDVVRRFPIAYASFKQQAQYEDQNLVDVWKEGQEEFNQARQQLFQAIEVLHKFLDHILRKDNKLHPEDRYFRFKETESGDGLLIEVLKDAPKKSRQKKAVEFVPLTVFEQPPLSELGITLNGTADTNPQPRSRNAA
jgi:hypothetical protein